MGYESNTVVVEAKPSVAISKNITNEPRNLLKK
jgi:hypothetical protein